MRAAVIGGGLFAASLLQWQPTLTVHDPNPPLTLETPGDVGYPRPYYHVTGGVLAVNGRLTMPAQLLWAPALMVSDSAPPPPVISSDVLPPMRSLAGGFGGFLGGR